MRKRRTADEAKQLILNTAERRLGEMGLQGLNIVGVANEAGISHATLIHHFGNAEGMRSALADHMTEHLIADVMGALDQDVPAKQLFEDLFRTLSGGGHAKLLAWMAVEEGTSTAHTQKSFDSLIRACADRLETFDIEQVRNIVFLVAATAIGANIATAMPTLIGMNRASVEAFPEWFARQVEHLHH